MAPAIRSGHKPVYPFPHRVSLVDFCRRDKPICPIEGNGWTTRRVGDVISRARRLQANRANRQRKCRRAGTVRARQQSNGCSYDFVGQKKLSSTATAAVISPEEDVE